jgi:Holliday junction resolvase RusA-like endonuclease
MNGKRSRDRRTRQNADLERTTGNESISPGKGPAFTAPVSIAVHHYRCRLADPDGLSIKAALDGIVHCNLLRDDSAKEITEIRHYQYKVKNADEERTEIIITEVTDGTNR